MKPDKNHNLLLQDLSNCIKILTADAVENAKSGHPGMPLGMSDVMTILALEFLKYNPKEPKWFNRDRLVLSAGHGSMLLYAFYYLAGFKDFSLEDIKNFRKLNSKAAGHPEHEIYSAIETTTGPLGQGLATAVGMAIAGKKYQTKLGKEIADYKIYAIVGDGCLMEGISYEASSLAGHLSLDNLIVIFDDNGISIDGGTNLAVSENHLAKFTALGFEAEAIDGHDFNQIRAALTRANCSSKPYFIACKTTIGKGTKFKAGSEKAHGSPLGKDEIEHLKNTTSFKQEAFAIEPTLLSYWQDYATRHLADFQRWQQSFESLTLEDKNYLTDVVNVHKISEKLFAATLLTREATGPEASRVSSGKILQEIIKNEEKIICGSADLSSSNNVLGENSKVINAKDFSGNFIHYGVRENAMGAIMNGLALSGFLPIGATFLVFSDYMRPSIRLSAIMRTKVLYIMTHDSIGVGEDGPTHQPIEHLASFRAMPNIKVFRPADFIETLECYNSALSYDGPSILALSRQNLPQIRNNNSVNYYYKGKENTSSAPVNMCDNGAYIVQCSNLDDSTENSQEIVIAQNEAGTRAARNVDVAIFATGSELAIGVTVKELLEKDYGKKVVLISIPCFENLEEQPSSYLDELALNAHLKVGIEAGSSFGWSKIIGDKGLFFGLDRFGLSAPSDILYDYFGLNAQKIVKKIVEKF